MPTKERVEKVNRVLSLRQPDLRVVLERVTNTHNASAVTRTCDAAGILSIDIISDSPDPFPINEAISTRAEKWIEFTKYSSASECLTRLKSEGYQVIATHLGPDSIPYTEVDYTQAVAIVFGNESAGISEEALKYADYVIKIPMFGMVQSLNLSVSAGIILYEAIRQRFSKGFYKKARLSREAFSRLQSQWLKINRE